MSHPLHEWLAFQDRMPIAVAIQDHAPGEAETHQWQERNLRALNGIATLDERPAPREGNTTAEDQELQRLHNKVDLALELLAMLVDRMDNASRDVQQVRLSREGLAWPREFRDIPPGSLVTVELHLHPAMPIPFRWYGEVVGVYEGEVCVRFAPMSGSCGAALERYVFIRHRRSVASTRSPG